MRALVIGADGFAGRWLTKAPIRKWDVVVAGVGPTSLVPIRTPTR